MNRELWQSVVIRKKAFIIVIIERTRDDLSRRGGARARCRRARAERELVRPEGWTRLLRPSCNKRAQPGSGAGRGKGAAIQERGQEEEEVEGGRWRRRRRRSDGDARRDWGCGLCATGVSLGSSGEAHTPAAPTAHPQAKRCRCFCSS